MPACNGIMVLPGMNSGWFSGNNISVVSCAPLLGSALWEVYKIYIKQKDVMEGYPIACSMNGRIIV